MFGLFGKRKAKKEKPSRQLSDSDHYKAWCKEAESKAGAGGPKPSLWAAPPSGTAAQEAAERPVVDVQERTEGLLRVRFNGSTASVERTALLHGAELRLHEGGSEALSPSSIIPLAGARLEVLEGSAFSITPAAGAAMQLQAADEGEQRQWLAALQRVDGLHRQLEDFYDVGDAWAAGASGRLRHCWSRLTGRRYALRTYADGAAASALQQELRFLRLFSNDGIRHPQIPHLVDVFEERDGAPPKLVLELMEGGQLFRSRPPFSEREARAVFRQLVEGFVQLHACGWAHGSLTLDAVILLTAHGVAQVMILDFPAIHAIPGTSIEVLQERPAPSGTIAPELLYQGRLSHAADMWALGAALYQMLCGQPPPVPATASTAAVAFEGKVWEGMSVAAKDVVQKLLAVNPRERLTVAQLLEQRWMVSEMSRVSATARISATATGDVQGPTPRSSVDAGAGAPSSQAAPEIGTTPAAPTPLPAVQRTASGRSAPGSPNLASQGVQPKIGFFNAAGAAESTAEGNSGGGGGGASAAAAAGTFTAASSSLRVPSGGSPSSLLSQQLADSKSSTASLADSLKADPHSLEATTSPESGNPPAKAAGSAAAAPASPFAAVSPFAAATRAPGIPGHKPSNAGDQATPLPDFGSASPQPRRSFMGTEQIGPGGRSGTAHRRASLSALNATDARAASSLEERTASGGGRLRNFLRRTSMDTIGGGGGETGETSPGAGSPSSPRRDSLMRQSLGAMKRGSIGVVGSLKSSEYSEKAIEHGSNAAFYDYDYFLGGEREPNRLVEKLRRTSMASSR